MAQGAATDALPEPRYPARIAQADDALRRIAALPRPLVFTNGVFDLLHRGHVTYLEQAKGLGAALGGGGNSDASVRRLGKDGDRPLNTLDDRMAVLAALACVDLVVPFDSDTPGDSSRFRSATITRRHRCCAAFVAERCCAPSR